MRPLPTALCLALALAGPARATAPAPKARKAAAASAPRAAAPAASEGEPLPAYAASTEPVTVELVSCRFAEVDARITGLSATFRQFARLEGQDTVQQVEGSVLFQKPDLMRLTHRVPEAQTVVSDGRWLWVHRPATNQVIQTRLESWRRKEPLARGLLDFGRSADLLKRYEAAVSTVSAPDPAGYRTFEVRLTPRAEERRGADADFVLVLKASTRDFFPGEATLRVGRASIRSTFNDVRINPRLPDGTFRFSPPAGADVFTTPDQP